MSPASPMALAIAGPAQVQSAGEAARSLAGAAGFAEREREEVALAVVELASNLVKHAGGGELRLRSIDEGGRRGVEIISEDRGPGIAQPEQAVADGFSTARSLGAGLGAVNRLMDEVELSPRLDGGLRIVCQRWARPTPSAALQDRLEFGVATRAYHFQPVNGDAVVVRQWADHAIAGVIDGLGHGPLAHRAAEAARHYLEQHFDQPLLSLFRGVGRACRSTRGVVMALARFELARHQVELASVGNIESWLLGRAEAFQPIVRRGIVGLVTAPTPVLTRHQWTEESVLILHSDGVQGGWSAPELAALARQSPLAAARRLLERHSQKDDDATVLVARSADTRPQPTGNRVQSPD